MTMRRTGRILLGALLVAAAAAAACAQTPAGGAPTRFRSPCAYPARALRNHVEGRTLIGYRGTPDGRVTDVTVLESSGDGELDAAAAACVGRWRFDPAAPANAFFIGKRRTYIAWTIPPPVSGLPAAGTFAGIPHNCSRYYPKNAIAAKREGTTRVAFIIQTDGYVTDVTVEQSSGDAELDAAALTCVRAWHYIPAVQGGTPVATRWSADVAWKIH